MHIKKKEHGTIMVLKGIDTRNNPPNLYNMNTKTRENEAIIL